jgi:hypothetical protein
MSLSSLKKPAVIAISLVLVLATLFICIPKVTSLDNPHYFYGYVWYQNGSQVPAGTVVTLTDDNSGNSMTTTTIDLGDGTTNYYQADVSQITGSQDGDLVIVNCSSGGEVGENSTYINVSLGSQQVDLHLEPEVLNISIVPSQWNQGTVSLGSENYTSGGYFNLTNEGNVIINVMIKGSNATSNGDIWYLNNTADYDKFAMQYNKSSGWTSITTSYASFITNLAEGNSQLFDLKLIMPTASSTTNQMSFTITFKAVKA